MANKSMSVLPEAAAAEEDQPPPSMSCWNLTLRFALEVTALISIGMGGWAWTAKLTASKDGGDGGGAFLRWVAALGLPLAAAVAWGTFNVPDDPSRSGRAPVAVSGLARLSLELAIFGIGALGLLSSAGVAASASFVALVALHHAASVPRIRWMLR